jgi:hypothetical protein
LNGDDKSLSEYQNVAYDASSVKQKTAPANAMCAAKQNRTQAVGIAAND